jgi:hypothetical protein
MRRAEAGPTFNRPRSDHRTQRDPYERSGRRGVPSRAPRHRACAASASADGMGTLAACQHCIGVFGLVSIDGSDCPGSGKVDRCHRKLSAPMTDDEPGRDRWNLATSVGTGVGLTARTPPSSGFLARSDPVARSATGSNTRDNSPQVPTRLSRRFQLRCPAGRRSTGLGTLPVPTTESRHNEDARLACGRRSTAHGAGSDRAQQETLIQLVPGMQQLADQVRAWCGAEGKSGLRRAFKPWSTLTCRGSPILPQAPIAEPRACRS